MLKRKTEDRPPKAKDTVCGSHGAYFVQPQAEILFSGGLGCHAKQDRVGMGHGAAAKTGSQCFLSS